MKFQNETFAMYVNLKFNKPEVNVTIDREKAESLEFQLLILRKPYNCH
jgi:HAE1 family hydrophobic/amphiphilic exporter-1/multidrug efflux pump